MIKKELNYKSLPDSPGVYLMQDHDGRILYIGKAANLRRRVSSYFERPHDVRIEALVQRIRKIDHQTTDTALEALILEAELIKKFLPPYNVREKDDKSFLSIEITNDTFPRVQLARGKDPGHGGYRWGPFTSASSAREALRLLRRIFPWSTHESDRVGKFARPCFDYELGLCPGTCIGAIARGEYRKNIDHLKLFLDGKKKIVLRSLEKEMREASGELDFEKATALRHQLFALRHIRDTSLISDSPFIAPRSKDAELYRIEGYDISNISGTSAVGSMVVFEDGAPKKSDYRKFKIKTIFQPNDVGMLTEMLARRFKNNWRLPDLILVDGGVAQVSAARRVLRQASLNIPILGIVKGSERKRNDIIGAIPCGVPKATLVRVRDEAHRFAIQYHKKLRGARSLAHLATPQ